ncbi:MAG: hypothetical protein AVDCRST_MAG68-1361, partial [uncultured Gemmatimonadetes bacterium]
VHRRGAVALPEGEEEVLARSHHRHLPPPGRAPGAGAGLRARPLHLRALL